jgi:hypothetical protein
MNVVEGVFSEVWQDESPTASSHRLHLRCSLGQERLGYIGGPTGTAPTALHGGKKPLPALIHQRRGSGILGSSGDRIPIAFLLRVRLVWLTVERVLTCQRQAGGRR